MGSSDNPNWSIVSLIDDIPVADVDFGSASGGFFWNPQEFDPSFIPPSNVGAEIARSSVSSEGTKEPNTGKRTRSESFTIPASKACREKLRRDKLNDRFSELGSLLDPGKASKMDKSAILTDAARVVIQLRNEAQKLKDSNKNLQEKIKELKAEKNELREEKQRLKAEKESLEQEIRLSNARPSYMPHPPVMPTPFPVQGQAAGHKLMMPFIGYPGFQMWQVMQPADVDVTQDAAHRPPVA